MKQKLFFIVLYLSFALWSAIKTDFTVDEYHFHIPSGLAYYQTGDFKAVNPSNPPLTRLIVSLPLYLAGYRIDTASQAYRDFDAATLAESFFRTDTQKKKILGRIPVLIFGVLLLLLISSWAKALYGSRGEILAGILMATCPNLLAHSTTATTDLIFAFFWTWTCYLLWKAKEDPSIKQLLLVGIALGCTLATKHAAPVLVPFVFLFLLFDSGFAIAMVILFLSALVLWGIYGFEMRPFFEGVPRLDEKIAILSQFFSKWGLPPPVVQVLLKILHTVPMPLSSYFYSFAGVLNHARQGHTTFALGKWSETGFWYYYFVCLIAKLPLPSLLLIGAACLKKLRTAELYFLLPAAALFGVASLADLQLGIRYILPVLPALYLFASKLKPHWILSSIILALLIASNLRYAPDFIGYFNELTPRNKRLTVLHDSNVHWRVRR